MDHLEKIAEELKDHHVDENDKAHYAADLVNYSKNILKSIADEEDPSAHILQALEVAHLLSKDIPQAEVQKEDPEQAEEPAPEVAKPRWAVVNQEKSEFATPFHAMHKFNEEEGFEYVEGFEQVDEAVAFARTLDYNAVVVDIDWTGGLYAVRRIIENEVTEESE